MGFTADLSIPVLTVFLQGLLSFFSPCVLPMLPLYIGYLSGSGETAGDGTLRYSRGRCFVNTLFFVLGTGFAFFLLGLSMTALGTALSGHRMLVARIGGVLVILLGLYQLGVTNNRGAVDKNYRYLMSVSEMENLRQLRDEIQRVAPAELLCGTPLMITGLNVEALREGLN